MELFPFSDVRDKQDELMEAAENAIEEAKSLVAHAPTGLGKCVSGETQVLTDRGISRIDEIDPGDFLSCNSFDENLESTNSPA
ncbi:MAG: hypothetical protein ABEJ98_04250, partial [Candidatus Nanohaloarchaea archaeon]